VRELRYLTIADDLRRQVGTGSSPAGRILPSEAELSRAYGASRVTVRKALEQLRGEGLVDSRQGYGWFIVGHPVRQTLARLGTIEEQLAASGIEAERRVLEFGFTAATGRPRAVLGCDTVLRVRRLNLAEGAPFARVTVWVPEHLGAGLSRNDVAASSFYELLPVRLAVELGGAVQTIGASAADADDARLLDVPVGSPLLRCERVTSTVAGEPVILAEHVFAALRTEFVVELSAGDPSIAPSGLRLVDEVS
jgi:GntR family transcriptional regulator